MLKTAHHHHARGEELFNELMEKEAAKADILDKIIHGLRTERKALFAARKAGKDITKELAENNVKRVRAHNMRGRVYAHDNKMRDRYTATYTPSSEYKRRFTKIDSLGGVKDRSGRYTSINPRASNRDAGAYGLSKDLPNLSVDAGRQHAQMDFMNNVGAYYADGKLIANVHPSGQTAMRSGHLGRTNRSFFRDHVLPELRAQQEAGARVTYAKRMGRTNKYHRIVEDVKGYM